jgi:hypothetical protein
MLTKQALEYLKLGTGGSYSLARDAISHRIWDTRVFGATITNYVFFSQPINTVLTGTVLKTLNETNIQDTGKLPNGQTFLVNKMGVSFQSNQGLASASAAADMAAAFSLILKNSVFQIKLAGREFDFQAQGKQFLPMPLQELYPQANAGRVGDMIGSGWIKLDPTPIFLDQLVSFTVTQEIQNPIPTVAAALNTASSLLNGYYGEMQVVLDGFLTRAK